MSLQNGKTYGLHQQKTTYSNGKGSCLLLKPLFYDDRRTYQAEVLLEAIWS